MRLGLGQALITGPQSLAFRVRPLKQRQQSGSFARNSSWSGPARSDDLVVLLRLAANSGSEMGNASGACMLNWSPGATEERTVALRLAVGQGDDRTVAPRTLASCTNALAFVGADDQKVSAEGYPPWSGSSPSSTSRHKGPCLAAHRTKGTSTTYER